MGKFVEGSYPSVQDAIQAINALVTRGYSKEEITLVANQNKKKEITDVSIAVTTDSSHEALKSYQSDIEKGNIIALVEEDSSINDEQKTGSANYEADSPAEDPAPNPKLDANATTDNPLSDNSTPGNVPVGDDDDTPGGIPVDDHNDLTGKQL